MATSMHITMITHGEPRSLGRDAGKTRHESSPPIPLSVGGAHLIGDTLGVQEPAVRSPHFNIYVTDHRIEGPGALLHGAVYQERVRLGIGRGGQPQRPWGLGADGDRSGLDQIGARWHTAAEETTPHHHSNADADTGDKQCRAFIQTFLRDAH